ncbi:MAG TPA: extradiol ring-cleavage dioxygenase [Chloroflexota bacterium]|nr:extradiol ring-cleavage dioxygenase [Chloroflexota bacterium]
MAEVVLGIGTSHSPQLGIPGEQWRVLQAKDEGDSRMNYRELAERVRQTRPGFEKELTIEKFRERDEACQRAIGALGELLRDTRPDVMLVFGDDQHEQFLDDLMPMLCIYNGETMAIHRGRRAGAPPVSTSTEWRSVEGGRDQAEEGKEFRADPALADHLLRELCDDGFDIARSNHMRDGVGIGHAFSFVYRRLLPEGDIPMVPFMVNTFYPPNAPTPKRCYALGQSVRAAIERWDSNARVAVIASGGLSHTIIDEDLDRRTIDGLMERDPDRLRALPVEKMVHGTSEIRNWIIAGAALEGLDMTLVDYVPTYRSPAATGCGMTFAYWK